MLHVTEAVRNLVERDLARRENESVRKKGRLVAPRGRTHAVSDVVVDSQLALQVVVDEPRKPAAVENLSGPGYLRAGAYGRETPETY